VNTLRKIASSGRAIVCTIHQPSAELFFQFDSLLLLQSGGKQAYYGAIGRRGRAVKGESVSL
jgi:ABC-type multidrug transport system ATPase subunit